MLDWAREHGVGHAGEGAGEVVLRVGERGGAAALGVEVFDATAGFVEGAELDADLWGMLGLLFDLRSGGGAGTYACADSD